MRSAFLILALLVGSVVLAADKPVCDDPPECRKLPRTLSCSERLARYVQKCGPLPVEKVPVDRIIPVNVPCPSCPTCATCPTPPPPEIVTITVDVPAKPTGHTFLALGPLRREKWGATAVAGHAFTNGLTIMGGPVWLPGRAHNGRTYGCEQPCGEKGCDYGQTVCLDLPWHVNAPSPWGAQLLVGYTFR